MKKLNKEENNILILFIFLSLFVVAIGYTQSKGPKIGYIDMEYILQNVNGYIDATNQLEAKAQIWKQEIEVKKNEIKSCVLVRFKGAKKPMIFNKENKP